MRKDNGRREGNNQNIRNQRDNGEAGQSGKYEGEAGQSGKDDDYNP